MSVALGLVLGCGLAAGASAQERTGGTVELELPPDPPEAHLGFTPGEDRRVADWSQVVGYFEALARGSRRVQLDTIGRSTLDRPMLLATISHPENLDRLDELRDIQGRLADPRRIADEEDRAGLVREGRLVVLITSAIHPTEVGATLTPLTLAYHLASATDSATLEILRESVVLIVPSVNPDGVDLVADWYRESVGLPWEGEPPPRLYHHYAGHDINRDWYALTQVETANVVERVHNRWHPQIVHDMHQHEPWGSRFFVPPWLDPIEPNVDPLLVAATNALGTSIAWEMQRQGLTGVAVQTGYDAWGPARAYSHYHAGVRILSETASARLATPIEVHTEELGRGRWPGSTRTWNQPAPWPGGRWAMSDIVEYMEAGALALLRIASRDREAWLENFASIGERATAGWPEWPAAWLIPGGQANTAGVTELTRILLAARVEVQSTTTELSIGGEVYPAGTLVVDMRQPYASFVQAMLARQPYPGGPQYPGGPPRSPYDATAHNLPLLLGVEATPAADVPETGLRPVSEPGVPPSRRIRGLTAEPGVFVGLYQPRVSTADEGWTRWLLDRHEIPYAILHDAEIRQGDLIRRFTAIVIPSLGADLLEKGWSAGSMPDEYTGGLGADGLASLQAFAREGGTVVGLGDATDYLIDGLQLPVTDRLDGQPVEMFYTTGAQVRVVVDTATAVGRGMPSETGAWLQSGSAFDLHPGSGGGVVAAFGNPARVLSGWVHGAGLLTGGAAVVDVPAGAGRVVLFAIRPQYRGQTLATFPLLFNSLRTRGAASATR